MLKKVRASLTQGHQVASGLSENSPYPAGTIALQRSFFEAQGVDMQGLYSGTLNLSVAPQKFRIIEPEHTVKKLLWIEGFPAETFSFIRCTLIVKTKRYNGWIYYPHPETKIQHFQSDSVLEILCPFIRDIDYGDTLEFEYDDKNLSIYS